MDLALATIALFALITTLLLLVLLTSNTPAQTASPPDRDYQNGIIKYLKKDFDGAILEFGRGVGAETDFSMSRALDKNLVAVIERRAKMIEQTYSPWRHAAVPSR